MECWAGRLLDIWNNSNDDDDHRAAAGGGNEAVVGVWSSALETRRSLSLADVRSGISRLLGFPSKSAYFAFWKKLFLFDVVANVARVGGSLFLYVFAPHLYQMLPGGLVG